MGQAHGLGTSQADAAIYGACDIFLAQVRAQLPVARLAVVLLDPQQETGRVVFSCNAPPGSRMAPAATGMARYTGADPAGYAGGLGVSGRGWAAGTMFITGNDYWPSICVNLQGSPEILGAALFSAPPGDGYGPTEQRHARRLAEPLALALDNLRLQQRLQRRAEEADAFQLIAEGAASGTGIDHLCRQFTSQVKRLVEFHHLGIYLIDAEAGHLRRVSHGGPAAHRPKMGPARRLSGEEWLSPALHGDGHIAHDLVAAGPAALAWPGEVARAGLRAALTVPVVCSGRVIGAVRLSHRRRHSYQSHHLPLLQKAAHLLGPPIAYFQLQERLASQSALEDKIIRTVRVLVSNHDLEVAFREFANAVGEIIPVEWVILSWEGGISPHSQAVTVRVGAPESYATGPMPEGLATIGSPLRLGEQPVGTLTVGRRQPAFAAQEQPLLDRVAAHIAPAVQSHRHYRRARSQAYQLAQLQRSLPPGDPSRQREEPDQDLLVDAAHALRTPLTAIKGYSSSLLQSDLSWPPEVQLEFLKTIGRETDRLEQVVRDLLATPG